MIPMAKETMLPKKTQVKEVRQEGRLDLPWGCQGPSVGEGPSDKGLKEVTGQPGRYGRNRETEGTASAKVGVTCV